MSENLFREEALAHRADVRAWGDVLRIPPAWVRWTFALLVLVAVGSAAFLAWGSVTVYVHGVARVEPGAAGPVVAVWFAERDRPRIAPGLSMRLVDPSDATRVVWARLDALEAAPVPLASAVSALGSGGWPTPPAPSRLTMGRGTLVPGPRGEPAEATAGEILRVEAPAGTRSLLSILLGPARAAR